MADNRVGPSQKRALALLAHCVGIDGESLNLEDINMGGQKLLDNLTDQKFLKIGGVYNSTPPTYNDGDSVVFQFGPSGALKVDTELTLDGSSIFVDNVAVQGFDAEHAALTKKPLHISGIYRSSLPTYDNGDVALAHFTQDGKLMVDSTASFSPPAPLTTDLGVSAFALSTADTSFTGVDVGSRQKGSCQVVWTGVTAPGTPDGQFVVEISNDNTNWETHFTVDIDSASGNHLARTLDCDYKYTRARWVKNTVTAGTATITSIFKGI